MKQDTSLYALRCLRALQMYWNPVFPDDNVPYRAVASMIGTDGDPKDFEHQMDISMMRAESAITEANIKRGMLIAADRAISAVHALLKGDLETVAAQLDLARDAMLGITIG